MVIKKKVTKVCTAYVIACDICQRPLKKRKIRVSMQRATKGLNDRKEWSTDKSILFCPKCWKEVTNGNALQIKERR